MDSEAQEKIRKRRRDYQREYWRKHRELNNEYCKKKYQKNRESNKDTTEFDCFFAGYVFANPMVKDMYRKAKGKDINKYDERISGLRKK